MDKAIKSQTKLPEDSVKKILAPQYEKIKAKFDELEQRVKDMEIQYEKIAKLYNENPK